MGKGGLAFLVGGSLQHKVRGDFDIWLEGTFESFSVEVRFEENNFYFVVFIDHQVLCLIVLKLVLMI